MWSWLWMSGRRDWVVIIKALRTAVAEDLEILALARTRGHARMMKAGANRGATGENAIVQTSPKADVIMGPLAILMPTL